ncbi:Autophagy-related protein 3 A (Atg3A) [Monocercomonoides exilis]|uniref:Autophagy-related protein 3 A (Atg3A) n=1 Tax=Monocercomonoides exilis TaxID=2049356 RepID=UPI00355A5F04|nr:Autophagy-related protein 3 A (Atg3A) [Monocercomonoides exilis]|eukprot:MONOS_15212.1-p1 / transcript=MONOS_15212.1 / gene=MONOS_15212 / organism=Monocercomonoides_exilis_PA203 / gene_product=Autophagy-related protein 3 A (Atg3A) / transcript_product=Autophagy-related protein 3 A (Atg3A) / location=Mono_scaffold01171:23-651(-) / protein_length=147 / sequence_SO=supercontig / SO=protein_coding / is_pseudo=false
MKILFLILVYNSICKLHNFDGKDFDLDPLIKTGTNRYSGRYKGDDVYWNILSNVYVGDVEGCEDKEQVAVTASEGLCYGRASLENQTSSLINSTGGLLLNYTSSEMFLASFAIKIVCSEEESTPSITSTAFCCHYGNKIWMPCYKT